MRNILALIPVLIIIVPACAQNKVPSSEVQIKTALMAAPENKRDSATV